MTGPPVPMPAPLVAILLLAAAAGGCLGNADEAQPDDRGREGTAEPTSTPNATSATGTTATANGTPVEDRLKVSWDGSTGTYVTFCEFAVTNDCRSEVEVVPYAAGLLMPGVDGNVTAARLTMSWNATTPATETLSFGAMVMVPGCAECEHPMIAMVEGPAPLVIDAAGLSLPAAHPDAVLHLFVWLPDGAQSVGPTYTQAAVDQAFHVAGDVTFVV